MRLFPNVSTQSICRLSILSAIFLSPTILLANHNETYQSPGNKPKLTITHESNHTYQSNTQTSSVTITTSQSHTHNSGQHSGHGSGHRRSTQSDLFYIFLEIFDDALFFGGIASMERVEGSDNLGLTPRVEGELLLPFFKVDASALSSMAENEMGSDMSFEMGYGPWGLHYRNTHFLNDSTFNPITGYNKFDFLYRMSFGSTFEMDLGLGSYQVDEQTQFSMSLPIKIAFTPHNIIEFRPTWSQNISDYDLAFYSGTEFYSLKVGYRYIAQFDPFSTTPIKAYSNIYAGFSAHY